MFYAVHPLNEYHYRTISFSTHRVRERAEAKTTCGWKHGDSVTQDREGYVFDSKEEFEQWCQESDYKIDWEAKVIRYQEKK